MLFAVLVCVLVCVARGQQQPPRDSSCGDNDCVNPETNCSTPENCTPSVGGGPAVPGCGCNCVGCASCVQEINPVFNKQCGVNLVMVLDESGSIGCCTSTVRNAVNSFVSSFSQLNTIGGSATLGLVEFSDNARLVVAPGSSCSGIMCRLDNTYVNQVTTYVSGSNSGNGGYSPGGCTNWAAALSLAHTTAWRIDSAAGALTRPDIVLFFTDGNPTVHTNMGACNSNCNQNRVRRGDPQFFVGACNGNHVGGACYWSDIMKAAGVKVFLVGIGGVSSHVPNVQLMSGPRAWDQQATSFGTSDYIINANYGQLGALLNAVAKGLCPCLQDQTGCVALAGGPACNTQSNFDARVKITTANSASAALPSNAILEAFMYFDFFAGPSRWALEILQGSNLIRTDIINPCNVARQISCGGLCFTTADLGFVPRFFLANGDTTSTAGSGFVPGDATCAAGQVYLKGLNPSGSGIERIWTIGTGASAQICAARAADGTLYEFFKDAGKTVAGVNWRNPGKPQQLRLSSTTAFNFDQLNSCSNAICNAEVEILFVIDQNQNQGDYYLSQAYVGDIARSFDDNNNRIRMGAYFSRAADVIPFQTQLSIFANQVLAVPKPTPISTNFLTTTTNAINAFWPTNRTASDPPRYLLTIVGSVDTQGTWTGPQQTTFDQLRVNRGIEAWATGVATGGTQFSTLISLSDVTTSRPPLVQASYNHYTGLASSSLLTTQFKDQASRMCPRADLCGGSCQGLCLCGVCSCPQTCATPVDRCRSASCPASNPGSGCVVVDKRTTPIAQGGCLPLQPLPCTRYGCDAVTGNCLAADTPCTTNCGCASVANCTFNDLTGCPGTCNPKPIVCNGDVCGNACNPATGACNGQALVSEKYRCVVKLVAGQQVAVCENTDNTQSLCPPANNCTVTTCTSTGAATFSCASRNLTTLFDLCGVCLGDFSSCFFASVNAAQAAGLAAGVIAGIVIGAIAAAVIIACLSKKGYDAFIAQSAMSAPSMHNNAAFKNDGKTGDMVG